MQDACALTEDQSKQLLRLVRIKVHRFVGPGRRRREERRDLSQDMFLKVLQRLRGYDPARASLPTFASRVVESALADHVRSLNAAKRKGSRRSRPFDENRIVPTECTLRRQAAVLDLRLDVASTLRRLSRDEERLCERLKVLSVAEAAEELGLSRGTGYRRLQAIRERLQDTRLAAYIE